MPLAGFLQEHFARWALRRQNPPGGPIVLTQRHVFILPTRQGLAFAGALLVMLVAAINYNLSLGYALVFLLAGLGTATILHTFRNLAQLRVEAGRSFPAFAGEPAVFEVMLHNTRAETRTSIRLNLPGQAVQEVDVPPQDGVAVRLEMPSTRRGWLALPRVTLATTFPLGLIRAWGYAAPGLRCLIYPAPAAARLTPPRPHGDAGADAPLAAGMVDFAGLRDHQPADPLRHVAWKAAARQAEGPLLTKLFSGAAAETLWLDWEALPASLDVEARLSLLVRGVCDAYAAGIAWGLRLPGRSLGPAADEAHYHACLRQLALYESV